MFIINLLIPNILDVKAVVIVVVIVVVVVVAEVVVVVEAPILVRTL